MFRGMSVLKKLLTTFIGVIIIYTIITVISIFSIKNSIDLLNKLEKDTLPTLKYLADLAILTEKFALEINKLGNTSTSMDEMRRVLDKLQKYKEEADIVIAKYDKVALSKSERSDFEQFKALQKIAREINNDILLKTQLILKLTNVSERNKLINEIFDTLNTSDHMINLLNIVERNFENTSKYYMELSSKEAVNYSKNLVLIIVLSIISIFATLFIGVFISYSIVNPVNKVLKKLSSTSVNLEGVSKQVSGSAQNLSSTSSELASSVEEMTSSLEELQSIIEANTKNINESEIIMKETQTRTIDTSQKVEELRNAIMQIKDSNSRVVKINKVIDDIAFQTNILALNAAVEAARAGESGRGFAVVAEQVKTLANKSAEAARETANLIEKAISSVNVGESLMNSVVEAQSQSSEYISKVSTLLEEVTRSSTEQLKGINQITKAVSQINGVVQQNAASAEETAASGSELSRESEELLGIIRLVNNIINGKNATLKFEDKKVKSKKVETSEEEYDTYKDFEADEGIEEKEIEEPKEEIEVSYKPKIEQKPAKLQLSHKDDDVDIVRPEDVIPFDEDKPKTQKKQDFSDF